MKKLLLAACAAIAFGGTAQGQSMVCTDSTTGTSYTAVLQGGKIRLKGPSWSTNLTIVERSSSTQFTTRTNSKGIFTEVVFRDGPPQPGMIHYFKKGQAYAYRTDYCARAGSQQVQTRSNTVLDGIKAKCFAEWPGDYRMQKYCIDQQIEAYNALQRY